MPNENGAAPMPNPLEPLAAMAQSVASTLNAIAPHNVLAQLAKGGTPWGIRERRANREGYDLAARSAEQRAASERVGFSVTGRTIIF